MRTGLHRAVRFMIVLAVSVLVGCGGGGVPSGRSAGDSPQSPTAVLAVDERGPTVGPAGASQAPPATASTASGPASAKAVGSALPSEGTRVAHSALAGSPSSVVVGFGASAQGWFEHFSFSLAGTNSDGSPSMLAGSEADWGRIPDSAYDTQPLPPGAATSVACGDLDGDGVDEIVVGTGAAGQGKVYVYKPTSAGYVWFATVQLTQFPSYTSSGDASTWPACVDLDGDGRAEVVIGTGPRGQGFAQIWRYDAVARSFTPFSGTPYSNGYVRVAWSDYYNGPDASVRPAGGYLAGRGRPGQLVLGLGPQGQGWVQIWGWNGASLQPYALASNSAGWLQVRWTDYTRSTTDAAVYPAVGDLDGDGRDDLVLGLDDRGQGWFELFHATATDLQPQSWKQVPWSAYNASGRASTHPAVSDLDGDGRADIVVGLGDTSRGWLYVNQSSGADSWTQIRWGAFTASSLAATWPAMMHGASLGITSVQITPPNPSLPLGTTQQLTLTAVLGNATTVDLTATAQWTSSRPTVAGVAAGVVTPLATGTTTVTATIGGLSASTSLTVSPAALTAIQVTPPQTSLPRGLTRQFVATGVYTDHSTHDLTSQVTWTSGAAAVSINASGLATANDTGSATVTANLGAVTGSTTLTVTPAVLQSLQVTPASATVPKGLPQVFHAIGLYSDATTQDLSGSVTWSSSVPTCASISSSGTASSVAAGTTTIGVALQGLTAGASLTVTPAAVVSVAVDPASPSIAAGLDRPLHATAIYTDASSADVTPFATWSSSTSSVTVSNAAGTQGRATAVTPGSAVVSAAFGGKSGGTTVTVTAAVLQSIHLSASAETVPVGLSLPVTASGLFSDGSTQDLTSSVTWTSSAEALVVSNADGSRGLATGVSTGPSTVTATQDGIQGTLVVTVSAAVLQSITVSPPASSVPKGVVQPFAASGHFSDSTTRDVTEDVTWGSSDPAAVAISNVAGTRGQASTLAVSSVTITATSGGIHGDTNFSVRDAALVSLSITPSTTTLPKGLTRQLTATALYTDNTTADVTAQATWDASTGAAAVSNVDGTRGLVSALDIGPSSISASLGGKSATADVTVTAAALQSLAITPAAGSVPRGVAQAFTATGTYSDNSTQDLTGTVGWASSDPQTVDIAPSTGQAQTRAAGTVTVTATSGSVSASTTFTVTAAQLVSLHLTPPSPTVPRGRSQQLTATGTYTDDTTADLTAQVAWSSGDASVDVSIAGLATAVGTGSATVTASFGGINGSATVTASAAVLDAVQVNPPLLTLPKGLTHGFTATAVYSDNSTLDVTSQVTWLSDDASLDVSNAAGTNGVATARAAGAAHLSASLEGKSATADVTITAAVLQSLAITPVAGSVPKGVAQSFTATGTYSDASTQDLTTTVTWTSSDSAVLSISNAAGTRGRGTSLATGSVTVGASLGAISQSTPFTITEAQAVSVAVTPLAPSLPLGLTQAFTARATYTDGATVDVTTQATWASDGPAVSVSNAAASQGLATAAATGSASVSATFAGFSGSTTVTVTPAVLQQLAVSPPGPSVAAGNSQAFTASGTFSDGSSMDMTAAVTWTTSDGALASISNLAGTKGLATGLRAGSVTVRAAQGAVEGTASLQVTGPTVTALRIVPAAPVVVIGTTVRMAAYAVYSDGTSTKVTPTWTSTDGAVATVDAAGAVTSSAVGTTQIGASYGGASTSTPMTGVAGGFGFAYSALVPNAGTSTYAVATADFNEDGIPDIALTGFSPLGVVVYLGVGDGTFASPVTLSTANIAGDIWVADINGDGHADVLWGTSGGVARALGNGNGTFQSGSNLFARQGTGPTVAFGDVNGDGCADAVGASTGGQIFVLPMTASGTASSATYYTVGATVNAVAARDVNGDGRADVFACSASGLSVFLAQANGSLGTPVVYPAGTSPTDLVLGDVDGDGRLDVVTVSQSAGTASFLHGNGDGTFSAPITTADGRGPTVPVLADIDGDGHLDLLTVSNFSGTATDILYGRGDGTFKSAVGLNLPAVHNVLARDFNGDGRVDLSLPVSGGPKVLVQQADKTFGVPQVYDAGPNPNPQGLLRPYPADIVNVDLNLDGWPDVVVINGSAASLSIMLGDGTGGLQAPQFLTLSGTSPGYVASGDINNDGIPDLVAASGTVLQVFIGRGDGTFSAGANVSVNPTGGLELVDMNGDGKLDIVSADHGLVVAAGNGDGTFAAPVRISTGAPNAMGIGDLNQDGVPDVVLAESANNRINCFKGQGGFGFAAPAATSVSVSKDVVIADVNGDGKLDVVTCGNGLALSGRVAVMLGNGDGTLQSEIVYTQPIPLAHMRAADVNGDGKLDLVMLGALNPSFGLLVVPGNGDGTFATAGVNYTVASMPVALRVADVNRDGRPDILSIDSLGNGVLWLLHQ